MKNMIKAGVLLSAMSTLLFSGSTWAACNANVAITNPDSIYTDHGNGTVTDKQTNLMWMKCSLGLSGTSCGTGTATAMNWKQALEAAQTANSGAGTFGNSDWRLPTTAELRTLVEQACYDPAINASLFPATVNNAYWSSSPYAAGNGSAWYVNFGYGVESNYAKSANLYVRLVRSGQ